MADLKSPVASRAGHNAFFPIITPIKPICSEKTDFDGFNFDKPYTDSKAKY